MEEISEFRLENSFIKESFHYKWLGIIFLYALTSIPTRVDEDISKE